MREAREEMLQSLNESNLEKMRKAAKGAKQTLKMKDGSIGMDSFTASAIMQIYDKVNDKNKKTMENLLKDGKKADIVKLMKFAMTKVNAEYVPEKFEEEFELDENFRVLARKGMGAESSKEAKYGQEVDYYEPKRGDKHSGKITKVSGTGYEVTDDKTGKKFRFKFYDPKKAKQLMGEQVELDEAKYDLYHKDFSTAMQHSYKMAKKLYGITVDPKEIDDKVASGPKKPSEGKTNSYRLKGDKGAIQVQVYNKGGSKPFELNMYKEEAELDEGKMKQLHQLMKDGKSAKEIAKIMRLDLKTIKALIGEDIELGEAAGDVEDLLKMIDELENASKMHLGQSKRIRAHLQGMKDDDYAGQEIKTEGAAADARRAMRGDPDMRQRAFSKDDSATDDERKAASKNIMMQMRKAVSLRSFDVEFADGKKVKVPQKMGQAVINKYNSFRRPAEKEKFQAKISKSYRDMLKALKESIDEAGYVKGKDPMPAGKELAKLMKKKRKGKKESTLERMNKKIQENKNG